MSFGTVYQGRKTERRRVQWTIVRRKKQKSTTKFENLKTMCGEEKPYELLDGITCEKRI